MTPYTMALCVQMICAIRIQFIWSLFKRRKILRIRQKKTEERQALKFRMRRAKAKAPTMGAAALKWFRRVCLCVCVCVCVCGMIAQ